MKNPRLRFTCIMTLPVLLSACFLGSDRQPAEILRADGLYYTPNGSGLKSELLAGDTEAAMNGSGAPAAVVEPDVYRFSEDGTVLYAANAYRGLLAFDVSDRARPAWLGSVAVAGTPKEMYLHDGVLALLLDPSYGYSEPQSASSVMFLSPASAGSGPAALSTAALAGSIVDSRVVGDVLLVATNDGWTSTVVSESADASVSSVSTAGGFEASLRAVSLASRSVLSTFDLPGYCTAIHIDPACVFAASQEASWGSTATDLIRYDFTADGSLAPVSSVRIQGSIPDRFKLDYDEGILRVVASDASGYAARAFTIDYRTDPAAPVSHEDTALPIAPGERLFATRFSGDVCYVVTYRITDPLFVVSFADPVHPAVLSELGDIPGYSTHLEVVPDAEGHDRLFAVGIDDSANFQVKVSWFDASNPAAVSETGSILLGDSWSYSSANWDWKRINRLPDLSAFAVPYYSWSAEGGTWAVAIVKCTDSSLETFCVLPDSGDCLRTIAAADDLVYTYADDRLLSWQVAAGSAARTAEVVIAEDVAWASEIGGTGVKVVRRDDGVVVKTFDPTLYDRPESTGSLDLPVPEGNRYVWYSLGPGTVAMGPEGFHLLAAGYDEATGARSAYMVPVHVSGGLSLGSVRTLADTSGWAWVSCLESGARFVPAGGDGSRLAVFHGGLTLFDAATGGPIVSLAAENGIAAFVDGNDAWIFSHAPDTARDGYGLVTAVRWDIADPASPVKRAEASFPGFPVHHAGGGRFLSAFEVREDGEVSTVLMSVAVSDGQAAILDTESLDGALRAGWSQTGLFAFLQGEASYYWMMDYAVSARSSRRHRGASSGSTMLRTASIGADGSVPVSDVGILPDAGWGASLLREGGFLAAQAGRAVAACSVDSGAVSWLSSRLLDAAGWNLPVLSLAAGRLYWALGMEGIGREEIR